MDKIKIVIADDHNFYREGLKAYLRKQPFIEVIGDASTGPGLISLVESLHPDIVLTDLRMPDLNGIECLKKIKVLGVATKCIVFSYFNSKFQVLEALIAGALGYVTKDVDDNDFVEAIQAVHEGKTYFSQATLSELTIQITTKGHIAFGKAYTGILNTTEKLMVPLICQGKTNKEIAAIIFRSQRTVETARTRLFIKLGIDKTAELIVWAVQNGVYEP